MIDYELVSKYINEIVDEKGRDFVYQPVTRRATEQEILDLQLGEDATLTSCKYFEDGQPSCIVGHHLVRHLGIDPDEVEIEGLIVAQAVGRIAPGQYSAKAQMFLAELQSNQDGGMTWGESLERAHQSVEGLNE